MSTPSVIPTAAPSVTRPANRSGVIPYRVSVRQFTKMIGAGVFGEHDHVELLEGLLVDKMVKHPPHNFTVAEIADALRAIIGPRLGGSRGEIGRSGPLFASRARCRNSQRPACTVPFGFSRRGRSGNVDRSG